MASLLAAIILALAIQATANPLPVATPPPLRDDDSASEPAPRHSEPCTTVLTQLDYGFRGTNWSPSILRTVYTATKVVYKRVPCDGCELSITKSRAPGYGGIGPAAMITGVTTAEEPFTTTKTVCSADRTVGKQIPGAAVPRDEQQHEAREACTTTVTRETTPWWAQPNQNGTRTAYTATDTVYTTLDCGNCALAITTADIPGFGHGPELNSVTWVTVTGKDPATVTHTVCANAGAASAGASLMSTTPIDSGRSETPAPSTKPTTSPSTPPGNGTSSTKSPEPPATDKTTNPSPTSRGDGCTSTRTVALTPTMGPIMTIWTATDTSTSHVDCGGCRFVDSSAINGLHPGPVVAYTSTKTADEATTHTSFVCMKTPSVVAGSPTQTLPVETTGKSVVFGS